MRAAIPICGRLPTGVGTRTVNGTRAAVRTVIRYRHGVLSGRGASLLDGYMEDLATDRIYRLMIAQRVLHRDLVKIEDEQGRAVKHTPQFITQLFDEELDRLLRELPAGACPRRSGAFSPRPRNQRSHDRQWRIQPGIATHPKTKN